MTAEKDPRIEAVAKLLFTGPLFAHTAEQWQPGLYEEDRAYCLMAAEDVLRGIDEAAGWEYGVRYENGGHDWGLTHPREWVKEARELGDDKICLVRRRPAGEPEPLP